MSILTQYNYANKTIFKYVGDRVLKIKNYALEFSEGFVAN